MQEVKAEEVRIKGQLERWEERLSLEMLPKAGREVRGGNPTQAWMYRVVYKP